VSFQKALKGAVDYWSNQGRQLRQNVQNLPSDIRNQNTVRTNEAFFQSRKTPQQPAGAKIATDMNSWKNARANAIKKAGG
jgi:hypothetical protein